jgi:hypothetical protein
LHDDDDDDDDHDHDDDDVDDDDDLGKNDDAPNDNDDDDDDDGRRHTGEAVPDDPASRRKITMYRDGFTVDDGPFRSFEDPQNADFIRDLNRG